MATVTTECCYLYTLGKAYIRYKNPGEQKTSPYPNIGMSEGISDKKKKKKTIVRLGNRTEHDTHKREW